MSTIGVIRRPLVVAGVLAAIVVVMLARPEADDQPDALRATPAAAVAVARMVEFGSDKCVPCRLMKPVLAELGTKYGHMLSVEFVDVMKDRSAAQKHDIAMIPTQVFYDAAGRELTRHTGFIPIEDVVATFARHGVDLMARR